jgi:lincosamide and streptogramin A transport system ATP-binding/permease protein
MALIRIENVEFHFDDPHTPVFAGLSLVVDTSWRTALVGRNGRGKTTLFRLIRGELRPTRGAIEAPAGVVRFPYEPGNPFRPVREVVRDCVGPFTAREAEMERLLAAGDAVSLREYAVLQEAHEREGGYTIDARIERELAGLGLGEEIGERDFTTLSAGQQARALIAALFLRGDVFPLIDEPTNHLDMAGREALGRYLAGQRGYFLVSHDRHFLDLCCDHVVSLNREDVRVNQGDFSSWQDQMAREEEHERRRRDHLKREIRDLEDAARRRRTWSGRREKDKIGAFDKGRIGHLAARQMKRALASERRKKERLEEKKGLLRNVEKERRITLRAEERGPERVLSAHDVAVGYGGRAVLEGVSLTIDRGQRIALLGPNGCGKTTLLEALVGEREALAGSIHRPGHLTVVRGYQRPRWGEGLLREHLAREGIDETIFRTTMGSLGICGEIFDRPLETFSMGERKKVDLCRSFLGPAHLLVWDEPMNYVDLDSREDVEEVILREEPTLLFVEHDRRFVERIATDVIELA